MERLLEKLDSYLVKYVFEKATFMQKVPFLNKPRNLNIVLLVILGVILGPLLGWLIPGLKVPSPHVSLAAEPLSAHGSRWLTNAMLSTFIVDIVIIVGAILAATGIRLIPEKHWSNFMEWTVEGMYNLTESVSGKNVRVFFPWVMTIFVYVIISNYFGLIPGVGSIVVVRPAQAAQVIALDNQVAMAGQATLPAAPAEAAHEERVPLFRSPSADLNMTLALAFVSVLMTQYWGLTRLGKRYVQRFFVNPFKDVMGFVVGFFELIAELAKLISFSFRLFGNIFAGEVVLAVMAFLVPFVLPSVFYGLELFIGFIQALVFMLLTMAFFTIATISHDEHHQ